MTDPKNVSDQDDQEQPVERRPFSSDPTRVENTRVSDSTTISNAAWEVDAHKAARKPLRSGHASKARTSLPKTRFPPTIWLD